MVDRGGEIGDGEVGEYIISRGRGRRGQRFHGTFPRRPVALARALPCSLIMYRTPTRYPCAGEAGKSWSVLLLFSGAPLAGLSTLGRGGLAAGALLRTSALKRELIWAAPPQSGCAPSLLRHGRSCARRFGETHGVGDCGGHSIPHVVRGLARHQNTAWQASITLPPGTSVGECPGARLRAPEVSSSPSSSANAPLPHRLPCARRCHAAAALRSLASSSEQSILREAEREPCVPLPRPAAIPGGRPAQHDSAACSCQHHRVRFVASSSAVRYRRRCHDRGTAAKQQRYGTVRYGTAGRRAECPRNRRGGWGRRSTCDTIGPRVAIQ